eukprot:Pompholyxophrys_punicea_v1_NODE_123_length_3345_cov_12.350334.p1 type:complete len:265 gc:universal NODE_123_length_3345_cov_12.350334:1887-2681(+)
MHQHISNTISTPRHTQKFTTPHSTSATTTPNTSHSSHLLLLTTIDRSDYYTNITLQKHPTLPQLSTLNIMHHHPTPHHQPTTTIHSTNNHILSTSQQLLHLHQLFSNGAQTAPHLRHNHYYYQNILSSTKLNQHHNQTTPAPRTQQNYQYIQTHTISRRHLHPALLHLHSNHPLYTKRNLISAYLHRINTPTLHPTLAKHQLLLLRHKLKICNIQPSSPLTSKHYYNNFEIKLKLQITTQLATRHLSSHTSLHNTHNSTNTSET